MTQLGPRRGVFLDKDGTLVDDVPFNVDPARIRFVPFAEEAVRRLADAGFVLAIVSNQPGVARGLFDEAALATVAGEISTRLVALGVPLAGFYYCPHDPSGTVERYRRVCDCRKPAPGLLSRAARELDLDLGESWLVGDILDDIEAGRRVGCRTVLVDNGSETEWQLDTSRLPHHIVDDLDEAARLIVELDTARRERAETGER
ncbi:MAG: HAD family hydrolase [Gammaproteobacteria bacterium]|nr:hypothetical protein [Gammaproteobacteria bacterium]